MNTIIEINGKQNFMGKNIPVVLGGFGKDKKCISDKTIAEIHDVKTYHIRELIIRNLNRFEYDTDLIDLKVIVQDDNNLFSELGYSKMQITKSAHIYILSERGYAKLIKLMDTDLAWEVHDKLIDEYFQLRDGVGDYYDSKFLDIIVEQQKTIGEMVNICRDFMDTVQTITATTGNLSKPNVVHNYSHTKAKSANLFVWHKHGQMHKNLFHYWQIKQMIILQMQL